MVLPQALKEHLRGDRDFRKTSRFKPKEGFKKNTEIAKSREEEKEEEERVSFPHREPKLKQNSPQ